MNLNLRPISSLLFCDAQHPKAALSLAAVARVMQAQGDHSGAAVHYNTAWEYEEDAFGPEYVHLAFVWKCLQPVAARLRTFSPLFLYVATGP